MASMGPGSGKHHVQNNVGLQGVSSPIPGNRLEDLAPLNPSLETTPTFIPKVPPNETLDASINRLYMELLSHTESVGRKRSTDRFQHVPELTRQFIVQTGRSGSGLLVMLGQRVRNGRPEPSEGNSHRP